ncbi:MAG: YceD family protein [Erythrobacter sp.]|uniref:YceD family protein n=1 Tax=Erythrobacter sp. TaxID=1042 RepID=UPI0032EFAE49
MTDPTDQPGPEMSRLLKARPLPADPVVIEADAAEREALAHRFGLGGIDSLRAEVTLDQKAQAIRACGVLHAAVQQVCAISNENFPVTISEPFDLRFVPETVRPEPADEEEALEIELERDDLDEIEYAGEIFDLGEAVAQTLGLAIDPYAEGPGAETARQAAGLADEDAPRGPLAEALSALKKD